MLTEQELKKIRQEAEELYPDHSKISKQGIVDALREAYLHGAIAAVTAERERTQILVDALNEWATAKDEFDSGYSNKSGKTTRVNIAALSSAMQGAEMKLYRIFKQHEQ